MVNMSLYITCTKELLQTEFTAQETQMVSVAFMSHNAKLDNVTEKNTVLYVSFFVHFLITWSTELSP